MDISEFHESFQEVEEPPKKVCVVCQAPADKSCGACHGVYYCSVEHQKSDWKVHKKDCPPIRIATSPELGRHFVATRDLPPWSLLLTELPVLVNPYEINQDDNSSCISCRSILPTEPWPCFQCSTTYFCNLACSMDKIHTEFECGILSKCSERQREKLCIPPNLGYLRAIHLKNTDPQTWTKVLELGGANQYKPEDADESNKWFIPEILPLTGEKGVGFEADMVKLRGILQQRGIKNHPKGLNVSEWENGESQLLYMEATTFAHHCFPNCTRIIGKGPQFQLQVRTSIGIKKGAIVSIDYPGVSYELGAIYRQHRLDFIGGALCICPRCTDPTGTELGTMLSAVKCMEPNCKDGYLLPVDGKDMSENAPWRCNNSECKGKGSTWGEINGILNEMHNRSITFLRTVPLGDAERTKEFLVSLKKTLHANHWLILLFKKRKIDKLISDLTKEIINLSIPGTQLYISWLEDLIKMAEFTAPGLTLTRGHYWGRILSLLIAKLEAIGLDNDPCPKEFEKEFKKKAIEAIDQSCSIAKFYPETWPKDYTEMLMNFLRPQYQLELLLIQS